MRTRLATLLSAVLLVVLAAPAAAQYPPVNPGDTPQDSLTCVLNGDGTIGCAIAGLQVDSEASCTITAGTEAVIGKGTVAANGVVNIVVQAPAGMTTDTEFSTSCAGVDANGELVSVLGLFQERDEPAVGGEVAATGAESGVLALIALGLVGAGGGAVVLARRRSRVEA